MEQVYCESHLDGLIQVYNVFLDIGFYSGKKTPLNNEQILLYFDAL